MSAHKGALEAFHFRMLHGWQLLVWCCFLAMAENLSLHGWSNLKSQPTPRWGGRKPELHCHLGAIACVACLLWEVYCRMFSVFISGEVDGGLWTKPIPSVLPDVHFCKAPPISPGFWTLVPWTGGDWCGGGGDYSRPLWIGQVGSDGRHTWIVLLQPASCCCDRFQSGIINHWTVMLITQTAHLKNGQSTNGGKVCGTVWQLYLPFPGGSAAGSKEKQWCDWQVWTQVHLQGLPDRSPHSGLRSVSFREDTVSGAGVGHRDTADGIFTGEKWGFYLPPEDYRLVSLCFGC